MVMFGVILATEAALESLQEGEWAFKWLTLTVGKQKEFAPERSGGNAEN